MTRTERNCTQLTLSLATCSPCGRETPTTETITNMSTSYSNPTSIFLIRHPFPGEPRLATTSSVFFVELLQTKTIPDKWHSFYRQETNHVDD